MNQRDEEYWKKHYRMAASCGADTITVEKIPGSDWSAISCINNDGSATMIDIRSREMAEQVHFMLGQMLS